MNFKESKDILIPLVMKMVLQRKKNYLTLICQQRRRICLTLIC